MNAEEIAAASLEDAYSTQDFLDLLAIVADYGWAVNETGEIRDTNGRCPICALLHETHGVEETENFELAWWLAIKEHTPSWLHSIVAAADQKWAARRADLLAALNIEGEYA